MKTPFDICVSSQTPLVTFKLTSEELTKKYGKFSEPVDIKNLRESVDYDFTPGGVPKMVHPSLREMKARGIVNKAFWVALNQIGPSQILVDDIVGIHVKLRTEIRGGYGAAKETLWKIIHGIGEVIKDPSTVTWGEDYLSYQYYNRLCSEKMLALHKKEDFDIFYVHDFQNLLVASILRSVVTPKVFRWHIPFNEKSIPPKWYRYLSKYFGYYDSIIVSCRRYVDILKNVGFKGKMYQVYPHLDEKAYCRPSQNAVEQLCYKYGIESDDKVILTVARMDPMKGQDIAIKAMSQVVKRIPNVKLLLIGNGSFSSSKKSGVGLSKADSWREKLLKLTQELHIDQNVIFVGHAEHKELECAYARCDATLLPSTMEGFGLVVIEGWLYEKPAIVSSEAGVAELVKDENSGLIFNSGNDSELAEKITDLLSKSEVANDLGERGFECAKKCYLENGVKSVSEVLQNTIEGR